MDKRFKALQKRRDSIESKAWKSSIGVGPRIKSLLKRHKGMKWTQAELAYELGISQGSLSEIINGKSYPSASTLARMAHAGYNVHWVLTGEDEL